MTSVLPGLSTVAGEIPGLGSISSTLTGLNSSSSQPPRPGARPVPGHLGRERHAALQRHLTSLGSNEPGSGGSVVRAR